MHAASGSEGGRRKSSLLTFAALFVSEKREKKKSFFKFLRGRTMFAPTMRVVDGADPYKIKTRVKPITKIKNTISIPSAQVPNPRPPCTFSGRADNACTNLLGYLVRYVRTRGIAETVESGKTADF